MRVEDSTVTRSHGVAIYVTSGSKQATVRGNTVTATMKAGRYGESGAGIAMYEDVGTVVTGNTLKGNAGQPIFSYDSIGSTETVSEHDVLSPTREEPRLDGLPSNRGSRVALCARISVSSDQVEQVTTASPLAKARGLVACRGSWPA